MRVPLASIPRPVIALGAVLGAVVWIAARNAPEAADLAAASRNREDRTMVAEVPVGWVCREGGVSVELELALDEAVVRDADGLERSVLIDPPASRATLGIRLARLGDPGRVFPVAYPAGETRNETNRRLVTPDLRVRVDPEAAQLAAVRAGLELAERPDYAPDWVILRASDPLAALESLEALRESKSVAEAEVLLARQRFLRAMPNDPLIGDQWHLRRSGSAAAGTDVNIEQAWNFGGTGGVRGSGRRIAIIDNGVQLNHPDLVENMDSTNGWDWNGNDSNASPGPGNDHGTACAGLAAARGNNGIGVSGTAPNAQIVPLRLLASSVTDAQEAAAMSWKNELIEIKSNSWGPSDSGGVLDGPGPLTRAAIQSAVESGRGGRGTIFVWAAGNGAQNGDDSNQDGYANLPETIAVAAVDSLGRRAGYSEPGANLVVSAPSMGDVSTLGITTTDRTSGDGYHAATSANGGDYYSSFTGTSASAPMVAGIIALMLEKNPQLGWRDVQEILMRTASPVRPDDPGWQTNSAGLSFHHAFGAGLVNATAAVTLAGTWSNLGPRVSQAVQEHPNLAIPRGSVVGITRSLEFGGDGMRVEHVALTVDLDHPTRRDLEISLTSPGGMTSRLVRRQPKGTGGFPVWTFGSVRHWGEQSTGIWTLHIADLGGGSVSVGTLKSVQLALHGTAAAAENPRPVVAIVHPSDGQPLSPGLPIEVEISVSDLNSAGAPGEIASVQLLVDGEVTATRTAPPWILAVSPGLGAHTLIARATDTEGAIGTSGAISIVVANQPPRMLSATVSAGKQEFSDVGLSVDQVLADDPEGDPVTYSYQWQSSHDASNFNDVAGETAAVLAPDPARAGKLWRCLVTPTDGNSAGNALATLPVNLLARPPTLAVVHAPFRYAPGLVLRRGGVETGRMALLHEFSHGPGGDAGSWLEMLALESGDLRGWSVADGVGTSLVFADSPAWQDIPAGTLILIYDGTRARDPLLPADRVEIIDGRIVIGSNQPGLFSEGSADWLNLDPNGGSMFLRNRAGETVHQIAFGSDHSATPNIGGVGAGRAFHFIGDSGFAADFASQWRIVDATTRGQGAAATGHAPFFSEYLEGIGDDRALEVFNPTDRTIDLTAELYRIEIYSNGGGFAQYVIDLHGELAPGGAFVIAHPGTGLAIAADQASSALNFTGNDAIVLRRGADVLDRIGQVGANPGPAGWSANGVSTTDAVLRRKLTISGGDTAISAAFDPSLEWDAYPVGDRSGFGSHGGGPQPVAGVTPGAPNSRENHAFVAALRVGAATAPTRFRLRAGSSLPAGLDLDELTGELTGTPQADDLNQPFPIAIERYNELGESVAFAFELSVVPASYAAWIAGFPSVTASGPAADPDGDGWPNAVEFALGGDPQLADVPLAFTNEENGISLRYRISRHAENVSLIPEWSARLESESWSTQLIEVVTENESANWREMRVFLPHDPNHPRRFLRLRAVLEP